MDTILEERAASIFRIEGRVMMKVVSQKGGGRERRKSPVQANRNNATAL
jgi:hypothetical protein